MSGEEEAVVPACKTVTAARACRCWSGWRARSEAEVGPDAWKSEGSLSRRQAGAMPRVHAASWSGLADAVEAEADAALQDSCA